MNETIQITTILKILTENPNKEFSGNDFEGQKVSDKLLRLFKQGFVDRFLGQRKGQLGKRHIYFYRIKREDNSNE